MTFSTMEIEASPNINRRNEKIERVLQEFLDPNFKVKNDVHLNLFLMRLVGKNHDDRASRANGQLKKQLCQWIIRASNLWGKSELSPPATILSFALNLTSQLSCDEHTFFDLNCQNVFESLVGIAHENSTKHPYVTLGMITLFCSFLEHKSGVQWVVATTHWTDVINLGLLKIHSMYVGKKAYQFVIKLLEKTVCFNRTFAVNLVGLLIGPLNAVFRGNEDVERTQIQYGELVETLEPTLDCLSEVLTTLLKNFNSNILRLFLEQGTQETAEKILPLSQSEEFSFKLLKITFVFLFYKLCVKLHRVSVVAPDSPALCDITTMFDLIKNEMIKNNVRCIVKICDYAHDLYCSLALHMPLCVRKGEVIEFQNQMVFFQIMPLLVFCVQLLGYTDRPPEIFLNDAFRKDFIQRLLKTAAIKSIKICFKWGETLKVKPDLIEDVTFSLQYIVKAKKWLNKEQAASIFPALVYALRDILTIMGALTHIDWTPRFVKYITTLLKTMVDLVESFDLTWKDSVETIHVMDLACEFLNFPSFPDKTIVLKGLKLLKTAISKYMSPDMVLLIHRTKDSTVSQTGSLLYTKCRDGSWEIRDGALEVVYALSLNANSRFPALTDVLLDAELPQLVANMALKDDESFVRATAFRCLQEMIQISEIWDVLLRVDSFLNNLLGVLEDEAAGIVRKEMVTLVHRIYKFRNFPDEILPRLYDVMTHAALGDLHWEVKYNALEFWFESWKQHLTNQGMIDSSFPSHTYSKEHKKIVALTDVEIRKRIVKVLNQLSHVGCLYVMKRAIQDGGDVEVSKKATSFSRTLLDLFRKYKVSSDNLDVSEPLSFPILRGDAKYSKLFESASSASSTTMTAPSPADIDSLDSPQSFYSPYFDPLGPSHYGNTVRQQEGPIQITPSTQQDPPLDYTAANQVTLNSTATGTLFDMKIGGAKEEISGSPKLEFVLNSPTSPCDEPLSLFPTLFSAFTSNTQQDLPFDNTATNRVTSNFTPKSNLSDPDVNGAVGGASKSPKLENACNSPNSPCFDPLSPSHYGKSAHLQEVHMQTTPTAQQAPPLDETAANLVTANLAPKSNLSDIDMNGAQEETSKSPKLENVSNSPNSPCFDPSSPSHYRKSVHQQEVPIQTTPNSKMEQDPPLNDTAANQDTAKFDMDTSEAEDETSGTPKFENVCNSPNSPYFDPLSPLPARLSPSLDIGVMTLLSYYEESVHQREVPIQTTPNTQQDPPVDGIAANQIATGLIPMSRIFDMDTSGAEEGTPRTPKFEDDQANSITGDKILDELLDSNEMKLLEEMHNPSDQKTKHITIIRTRTYLAPSEFLRFIYNDDETRAREKTRQPNTRDEFDSLIDDILKEYNVVIDIK